MYQLQKLIRRYKLIAAMIGLVGALAIAFGVIGTLMALRIRAERDRNSLLLYNSLVAQAQGHIDAGETASAVATLDQCPLEHRGWEWQWLSSTVEQWDRVLTLDDSNRIHAVGFCDGATLLLSHGEDLRTARLWRAGETTHQLLALKRHEAPIRAFAFSHDGAAIATGDEKGVVRLWNAATGECFGQRSFKIQAPITSLAFKARGQLVLAIGESGAADVNSHLWLYRTGLNQCPLSRFVKSPIIAADVSPDAARVAVCVNDARIVIFDVESNQPLPEIQTGEVPTAAAFTPDGQQLIAAFNASRRVRLLESQTGRTIADLAGHKAGVGAVAVSSDGRMFATGDGLGAVITWDAATHQALRTIQASDYAIQTIAFTPDDRFIITGVGSKQVKFWSVRPPEPWIIAPDDGQPMASFALAADGRVALCGRVDGAIVRMEIDDLSKRQTLVLDESTVTCVAAAPGGSMCAAGNERGEIHIWDAAADPLPKLLSEHQHRIVALAFTSDGRRLMSADAKGGIVIEGLTGLAEPYRLGESFDSVTAISVSLDDQQVVAADAKGTIGVWNVRTGRRRAAWHAHDGGVNAVDVSPDGARLATAGNDRAIRLWDLESGREIRAWTQDQPSMAIVFSPDGKRLFSGGMSPSVEVWNVADGKQLLSLPWPNTSVQWIAFDGAAERLMAGSATKGLRLWDPKAMSMHLNTSLGGVGSIHATGAE